MPCRCLQFLPENSYLLLPPQPCSKTRAFMSTTPNYLLSSHGHGTKGQTPYWIWGYQNPSVSIFLVMEDIHKRLVLWYPRYSSTYLTTLLPPCISIIGRISLDWAWPNSLRITSTVSRAAWSGALHPSSVLIWFQTTNSLNGSGIIEGISFSTWAMPCLEAGPMPTDGQFMWRISVPTQVSSFLFSPLRPDPSTGLRATEGFLSQIQIVFMLLFNMNDYLIFTPWPLIFFSVPFFSRFLGNGVFLFSFLILVCFPPIRQGISFAGNAD